MPVGVQYDRLIELARERVEQEVPRPLSQRALRALAFAVLPHPRVMRVTLPFSRLASVQGLPRARAALARANSPTT
jgi:glycolate oxidase iron-sulfur subunit